MNTIRTSISLLALTAAVLILAACGGSSDSSAGAPAPRNTTVGVSDVDNVGNVLVDEQGAALYAADQEADGMVVCTDGCTSIWDPLTVSAGSRPSASQGLSGKLDTLKRPDGTQQVTFDGRLLYRFAEDPSSGTVTGNGLADTFDGRAFTWHVVTPQGVSTSSENSAPSSGLYGP